MNNVSILMTDGAAALIGIILLSTSRMTRQDKTLSNRLLTLLFYTIVFGSIFDYLSVWIDGATFKFSVPLFYIINNPMFIGPQILSYLWILYVYVYVTNSAIPEKLTFFVLAFPPLVTLALEITNFHTGILFSMDADHFYVRGPLGTVGFFVGGVYMTITVIMSLLSNRSRKDYMFFPIFSFIVPAFMGTFIQLVFYYVNVVWLGISIGIAATYISLQNRLIYIDSLTGLYNRAYMDYFLQNTLNKKSSDNKGTASFGGIMLDISSLRRINEDFGHSVGDMAIVDAAGIIKNAVEKNGISIHFSGDEFIVIVKASTEEAVIDIVNKIREGAKSFSKTFHSPYTIGFSIGYSMFVPGEDTYDSFLSRIDSKMYEEKTNKPMITL